MALRRRLALLFRKPASHGLIFGSERHFTGGPAPRKVVGSLAAGGLASRTASAALMGDGSRVRVCLGFMVVARGFGLSWPERRWQMAAGS
jgi:hypothetical protein